MSALAVLHIIFSSCIILFALSHDEFGRDVFQRFNDYVHRYNKSYKFGTMEFKRRESIFEQTLHRVEWLNRHRNSTHAALYGINQFSDLTPEEFKKYVHLAKVNVTLKKPYPRKKNLLQSKSVLEKLPKKVDWRHKNVVTSVNDQEQCGACWAFSTVETVESMYALKYGSLERWSVQQVVDCAAAPNKGCEGGDTCLTIGWLYESETEIVLAEDYPFKGKTGICAEDVKSDKTVRVARNFTCDSFVGEEYLMLLHLAYHGPLIAAVDASGWQDYLGGIIQFHCDSERNHAVQIVGYDITGEVPFYIVRNSWGTNFGNDGYLYIAIGKNMCRIAEEVSSLDVL